MPANRARTTPRRLLALMVPAVLLTLSACTSGDESAAAASTAEHFDCHLRRPVGCGFAVAVAEFQWATERLRGHWSRRPGGSRAHGQVDGLRAEQPGQHGAADRPSHVQSRQDFPGRQGAAARRARVGPEQAVGQQRQGNSLVADRPAHRQARAAGRRRDPYNLYFTPDGKHALVMAERLHRIDVRDPRTMRLQRSLPVKCSGINHADYTADLSHLVVSCEFSGQLLVIDRGVTKVEKVIDLNARKTPGGDTPMEARMSSGPKSQLRPGASAMPQDVRLTPDGRWFLAADMLRNGVWVIDASSFTIHRFIHTGKGAHGIYPSRDATRLFVSNRDEGTVSVLDAATLKPVARWRIPGGGSPDMGGVTADGTQLWLSGRYDAARLRHRHGHRPAAEVDPGPGRPPRAVRLAPARQLLAGSHREHAMTTLGLTMGGAASALGPDWLDPQYLLDTYGTAFFWISLVIVFIECGLFFPILPGDSLLFAIGIFIAGGELDIPLLVAIPALFVAAFAGNVVGYEIGRAIGAPCATTTAGSSARSTSTRPTSSSRSTVRRPWSSAASCRSCAPTSPGGRHRPDGPPALLHLVGRRRRAVGHLITLAGYFLGGVPISATTSRPRSCSSSSSRSCRCSTSTSSTAAHPSRRC